jgi:hypothetical protein
MGIKKQEPSEFTEGEGGHMNNETREWLHMMARTNEGRRKVLENLLKHQVGDEMSPEDVRTCQEALDTLNTTEQAAAVGLHMEGMADYHSHHLDLPDVAEELERGDL